MTIETVLRIEQYVDLPSRRDDLESLSPDDFAATRYNEKFLPAFIQESGGDPAIWKEILLFNEIGSLFDDLEVGDTVYVPQRLTRFARHPES